MALGANRGRVLGLVIGRGLKLAIIGASLGVSGLMASTRLTTSLLYGVNPKDPLTTTGVIVFMLVVAIIGSWVPARRATAIEPVRTLRVE